MEQVSTYCRDISGSIIAVCFKWSVNRCEG